MSKPRPSQALGHRERDLLEIVYKLGSATVAEVRAAMTDRRSYSAVRTMLNLLESKDFLRHEVEGNRHVYLPTISKAQARSSELRHLVDMFFEGSLEAVVVTFLASAQRRPSPAQLRRLSRLIADAARTEEA